jgi:hypothetical protein
MFEIDGKELVISMGAALGKSPEETAELIQFAGSL